MSGDTEQETPISTYNVDQLFETKSIDEIRLFKSKIASDIEKKKEELRTMVGERYRDLIEAANTISSIKGGAEEVSNSIGKIEKMTKAISGDRFASADSGAKLRSDSVLDEKKMKRMAYYALAGQIRLLMDAPEALWSAVESKENLLAAEIYLLARQVYHSLKFSPGGGQSLLSCEKIVQWFPVISRQWGAISHFKDVILQASRNRLEELSISPEAAAEELLVILLLRNISVENMVDQFLECRSKVLERLMGLEGARGSSKHQICEILRLFSNTMMVVYSSFLDEDESKIGTNLLPKIAQRTLHSANGLSDARKPPLSHMSIHGSPAGKYLPVKIKEFRPNPSHPVDPLGLKFVQEKCQQWVEKCRAKVGENVPLWLGYVESVRNLATIRQAASDVIAEDSFSEAWDSVSSTLLPQEKDRFRRWEDLFLPSFTSRVSAIVDSKWSLLSTDLTAKVADFFARVEKDPSSEWNLCPYIWSESAGDLPEGEGWIRPATSAHITLDSGGLPMKTLGYSKEVLQLCRWVNDEVSKIIDDVEPYVDPDTSRADEPAKKEPFDQRADRTIVLEKLASAAKSACSRFLEETFSHLDETKEEEFRVASAKFIYLARVCQAMPQLCSALRRSVQFSEAGKPVPVQFQAIWEEAKSKAYFLWRKRLPVEFRAHLEANFPSIGAATVLGILPQWDVIRIEEENEEGVKVASSISLPSAPSSALLNAMFVVAEAVNAAGVHVIPQDVKSGLAEDLVATLLDHYSACLDNKENRPVTQPIAIQLIFDIQHAAQLLLSRTNNNASVSSSAASLLKEVTKLREQLEEFVDPFDLDVFTPHLNGNLKKCLGRTEGLFGVLAARDKATQSLSSSEPKSLPANDTSTHSQGSSLGTGSAHRFPLLPLAVQKPQSSFLDSYVNSVTSTGYHTPTPGHSRSSSYGSSAGLVDKAKDVKAKGGSQASSAEKLKRNDASAKKKADQGQQKSGAAFFFEAIGSNWFGSGS